MKYFIKRANTPIISHEKTPGFIDKFFSEISLPMINESDFQIPATDIYESDDGYDLFTELPGITKNDIHLSLQEKTLTIEAGHEEDDQEKPDKRLLRKERAQGKYFRRFTLGEGMSGEKMEARFENGLLSLHIPKSGIASTPEEVSIPVM